MTAAPEGSGQGAQGTGRIVTVLGGTPRARDQITMDNRTLAVQGVRAVFDWPSGIGFDCWYRG